MNRVTTDEPSTGRSPRFACRTDGANVTARRRLRKPALKPLLRDVSGTVSAGRLNVQFSGSLTGSLEMSFSSSSQSVSVSVGTKGAGIKGVQVSLSRM